MEGKGFWAFFVPVTCILYVIEEVCAFEKCLNVLCNTLQHEHEVKDAGLDKGIIICSLMAK